MNLATLSTVLGIAATLGGGGYWVGTTFATNDSVIVIASKADYALDKHLESLLAQANRLEEKRNKTPDDLDQLRYLRDEINRLREIRRGK